MEVISLSKDKVKIFDKTVLKKTTIQEYENILMAKKLLFQKDEIEIGNKFYKFLIPKILDFDGNNLLLERCFGDNLEIQLRNESSHNQYVNYINRIFSQLLANNYYWLDFAPRNIIIGDGNIYLFDFERGFLDVSSKKSDYLLQPNVYEEYGAFLLPNERLFDFLDIPYCDKIINVNNIGSKRIRMILHYWGFNNEVPFSVYLRALNQIISVETPYIDKGHINFPIIELEDYISNKGHEEYTKLVLRRKNDKV